jgi:hypothetical protein
MVFKSLVHSVTSDNVSEYLDDIIDYHDSFKVFGTPFEIMYSGPPCLEDVDRIYDACIEEEDFTGDSLYNVSFRFLGVDGIMYYAYAHMRINYGYDIEEEFIRGSMFVTKSPELFFMTTIPSIEQTDDLYAFLLEDGLDLCFNEDQLPLMAQVSLANYALQIEMP